PPWQLSWGLLRRFPVESIAFGGWRTGPKHFRRAFISWAQRNGSQWVESRTGKRNCRSILRVNLVAKAKLSGPRRVQCCMKSKLTVWTGLFFGFVMVSGYGAAQVPVAPSQDHGEPPPPMATGPVFTGPVALEWTPPALEYLSAHASMKESFTLDRSMLAAAAGVLPDSDADVRQAINRLDGVSVHILRFPDN